MDAQERLIVAIEVEKQIESVTNKGKLITKTNGERKRERERDTGNIHFIN